MAGRKKLYEPENLKVGQRIQLKGDRKNFANQYRYNWETRLNKDRIFDLEFKVKREGTKVFIERVN